MSRVIKNETKQKEIKKQEKQDVSKKIIVFIVKLFLIIFILLTALVLYTRFVSTSGLIVKEYKVESSILTDSFHGFKIIHFSDLHYGSTINKKELTNLVKKINQLNPHIVVFTGDLIDKDSAQKSQLTNELKELLSSIKPIIDKYAVSGNHDYIDGSYEDMMISTGFKMLNNSYELIYYKDNTPILINGLSSSIKSHIDVESAFIYQNNLENKELYTITLMHEPDSIDEVLTKYKTNLTLSGHSHNGQIRLPFVGGIKTINGAKKYNEEFYQINDTSLYISSGLGTSLYKFRFFNRPSINFYRLSTSN